MVETLCIGTRNPRYIGLLWLVDVPLAATTNSTNHTWRNLVLNDNIDTAVTIPSTIIRIVLAAQFATCTTMLAGILMECFDTRLSRIAPLSMLRAFGTAPWDLILNKVFNISSWPVLVLTLVLCFVALTSQFTSTLLVSDLGPSTIVGNAENVTRSYALDFTAEERFQNLEPDYSILSPSFFPSFAETHTPQFVQKQPGLGDTVKIVRAILPISSTEDEKSYRAIVGMLRCLTRESFASNLLL